MKTIKFIWNHLEEFLLLPILSFSVSIVFLQVIMRYCFNNALSWVEELARYLFVWQMWLGVSYATRNQTHLRITMLTGKFSAKVQKCIDLVVYAIWFGFGIFVVLKGIQIVGNIAKFHQLSAALQLPMQYAYMAIPVGAGMMCLRLIEIVIRDYICPAKNAKEGDAI